MKNDVLMRCHDLQKLIIGSANELTTLQQMSDTITTRQLEDVFQSVNSNTKYLVDASAAQERASASLEIMQVSSPTRYPRSRRPGIYLFLPCVFPCRHALLPPHPGHPVRLLRL